MKFALPRPVTCDVQPVQADLFRAYWISLLGGIYADVDMELQKPLRDWVRLRRLVEALGCHSSRLSS